MQPTVGAWRVLRALVVAAVCVGISLFAHAAAGGALPDDRVVLAAWAIAGIVAYLLSGRQWTFGRLLVVLGSGQALLHPAFEYAQRALRPMDHDATNPTVMMAAHLAAAVLLAAALARGDSALCRLLALVSAMLRPLANILRGRCLLVVTGPDPLRPVRVAQFGATIAVQRFVGTHSTRAPPHTMQVPPIR